jgi:hypothetical protein
MDGMYRISEERSEGKLWVATEEASLGDGLVAGFQAPKWF